MVRMSGYKYQKLLDGLLCGEVPAESAETRWTYVIHNANDVYSGGSETEMSGRYSIQMLIHRNGLLAATKDCMDFMYNC